MPLVQNMRGIPALPIPSPRYERGYYHWPERILPRLQLPGTVLRVELMKIILVRDGRKKEKNQIFRSKIIGPSYALLEAPSCTTTPFFNIWTVIGI